MPTKKTSTKNSRVRHQRVTTHGNVKHKAKPASIETVLNTYGIKKTDYNRVRKLVSSQLDKEAANAR